jgi:hypothetical protein
MTNKTNTPGKFHWIMVWIDNETNFHQKYTLIELLDEVAEETGETREYIAEAVARESATLLKSSDGINYQQVKIIPPKDTWSTEVWSK